MQSQFIGLCVGYKISKVILLTLVNTTITHFKVRSYNRFAEMFALNPILTTFEKFDHYGAHNRGCYGDSIHGLCRTSLVSWFSGAGPSVISNEKYKLPVTTFSNKYAATVTLG